MAETEFVINTVQSRTTATPGRSISEVRANELIIDEPTHLGGPGERMTPAEAFLSGIAACGVLLVEGRARATGAPLNGVQATIEAVRERRDTSVFQKIGIAFVVAGPKQAQAEALVAYYQQH
ncbi:MAG TPA: OsmC family protein [Candidatus Dormibacteraeota bacterium]|jgi:uncharacterized OsmC-like protein